MIPRIRGVHLMIPPQEKDLLGNRIPYQFIGIFDNVPRCASDRVRQGWLNVGGGQWCPRVRRHGGGELAQGRLGLGLLEHLGLGFLEGLGLGLLGLPAGRWPQAKREHSNKGHLSQHCTVNRPLYIFDGTRRAACIPSAPLSKQYETHLASAAFEPGDDLPARLLPPYPRVGPSIWGTRARGVVKVYCRGI